MKSSGAAPAVLASPAAPRSLRRAPRPSPAPAHIRSAVEADDLAALIGLIYDAVLDPARWPWALEACRAFIGGHSASQLARDIAGRSATLNHHDDRRDPDSARLSFERFCALAPATAGRIDAEIDEPISSASLLNDDAFRQTPFDREWVAPQQLVDFAVAPIEKAGGWAVMFGVLRHERDGMMDEPALARLRLIAPHIRRAVRIGRALERSGAESASFSDTFDGLASGMFMVDARGRIRHANAAGEAMLEQGVAVLARQGRLVSPDRRAGAALTEAFAATGGGDMAPGARGISIAIAGRNEENYVAHVLPLTSGRRRRAPTRHAADAVVFVQRAVLDLPAAADVIAKTYGLTPSEVRVLMTVVQVGGVAETADALGIGEATVKTHLHRVFAKTGTGRQADLVKLVAGYASPLR